MTYEAPSVEGAIVRRIHDLLVDAMAEAGRVLAGAGASPGEMLEMTVPFMPLMRLLRDSLEVRSEFVPGNPPVASSEPRGLEGPSFPKSPEKIESDFLNRGSAPGNVFPMRRR